MPRAAVPAHHHVASVRWSNRQHARTNEIHATLIHFQKCYSTIQEMFDTSSGHAKNFLKFLNHENLRFLDIACAPGGFSQFLLEHYPDSEAYGITLPEHLGGFPVTVTIPHRFHLCEFDLLSHPRSPEPLVPCEIDFAIADAQYLPRSQETLETYGGKKACTVTAGRLGLLLREFVIALRHLKEGGVFAFRFVVWENVHANILRLFLLCYDLFETIEPFKSEYQHTADCTFYCICSGFKRNVYIEKDIDTLLKVAFARVVLSPPFAAVHNGKINCIQVIKSAQPTGETNLIMDKRDAHILDQMYPFKDMENHEGFGKMTEMFEYVYKMFLIGQASYTDHFKVQQTSNHRFSNR